MSALDNLPSEVRAAMLRSVKRTVMDHYTCDRRKLEPWNDFRASLVSINSGFQPVDRGKNLRLLVKLTKAGVLLEKPRWRDGIGGRSFTLPRHQLDELAAQAISEWEEEGYVVGVMMPVIRKGKEVEA